MAYRFDFNRFADIAMPLEDSGILFDYELSVSQETPHVSSCCCEACDQDTSEDHLRSEGVEYTDTDASAFDSGMYINYGLNGYSNPYLDFGAFEQHEHDHDVKDDSSPLFSGAGDEYADDAANTNGLGLGSIVIGGRAEGVRNDGSDVDFFEVDLVAGQEYIFIMLRDTVDGTNPHADPWLYLYGTDGTTQLASNDDFGGQNSRITFTATTTGTHYLGASGFAAQTGGYTLFAEESDQRPDFTLGEIANFLTDQFSTRSLWNQTTITYNVDAIDDGAAGEATRADGSAYVVLPILEAALDAWAEVTGLNFVQVTGAGNGDITFIDNQNGAYSSSSTTAYVNGSRTILSSTINVSHNGWIDVYGDEINSYSYQTYIHEIGHTLGLGHGGAYNGSADYGDDNTYIQDSWATTVMSYFSHNEAGVGTSRLVLGLQPADLLAIHDLYGAAANTRGGDTTYGANATDAGSIYDFDAWDAQGIRPPSFAIYDTGGIDTFDVSIYSTNQTINLMPSGDFASFSSVGNNGGQALSNIITIAVGTIIENAVGGSGNDTITGNDANNELEGNAGNDVLDGGAGTDYAIYNGAQAAYTITDNGDGTWTITGEGTDTLSNIQFARFTDGDVALATANEINGTSGDDNPLFGTNGDDIINGFAGNDIIVGLDGNDTINGGEGDDWMDGGVGADLLNGGAGFDLLLYGGSNAAVTVNLATGFASGGHADGDNFTGIEGVVGSNNFGDMLTGDANENVLNGQGGNDILDGGAGDDAAVYLNVLQSDLTVTDNMDGTYTVTDNTGMWGTDTLSNIEYLLFDNNTFVDITTLVASGPINGTPGNDMLDGTEGNDVINGLAGDDVINGLGGDDVINAGPGSDVVNAGDGNDTIVFNTADGDVFGDYNGGAGYDVLRINGDYVANDTDNDVIDASFINNDFSSIEEIEFILDGDSSPREFIIGSGEVSSSELSDTANINGRGAGDFDNITVVVSDGVAIDVSGWTFQDWTVGEDNVSLIGSAFADNITGSIISDGLFGNAGDDSLFGLDGDDIFVGGAGDDVLNGGNDVDLASYSGDAADFNIVNNGDGTYTVTDSTGAEGTDTLIDIENVQIGPTLIDLSTINPSSIINGTPGNDNLLGTLGDDVINGLAGNDVLDGLAGDDELNGGDGADRLIGGTGADMLNGGAGFDSVDYRGASSAIRFAVLSGGTLGEAAGDTFSGIERYYLSNFNDIVTGSDANEFIYGEAGNDVINAGGGADRVYGGEGNDTQRGQAGNDTLYGSNGVDELDGGTGFDTVSYDLAGGAVSVNLATGGTAGEAAGDSYISIESVFGSDFDDILIGDSGANRFYGGMGGDVINGAGGFDSAYYTNATAAVTLDLATGGTGGDAAGDSFISIEWVYGSNFDDELTGDNGANRLYGLNGDDMLNGAGGNDRLFGGAGDDTINGGDGIDVLYGQAGNDILSGGAGNDFFFGGAGGDSFDGGAAFDTVNYLTAATGVSVNLMTGGTAGEAAGDSYISIERVLGTLQADSLTGDAGNNTLIGATGNDYLAGGAGADNLYGGGGSDSFGYNTTEDGQDFIRDFTTDELIYILGGDPAFDTWAEVQAVGVDAGTNLIFDFGGGNRLIVLGQNLADLDASNFDFGGTPPAAAPLDDADVFAADIVDTFDMDALI